MKDSIKTSIYRSIFNVTKSPILVLSLQLEIILINKRAEQLLHCNTCSVGKSYLTVSEFENETILPSIIDLQKLTPSKNYCLIETKNKTNNFEWECQFVENEHESFYLLLGNDVTQLRKAEAKIYELDSVVAQLPGNVYWYSKDLVYLGCNENSAKTLNITRAETVGQDFRQLMSRVKDITPETIEQFVQDGETVIRSGKPKLNIAEPPFIGPNGKWSYWIANKVPLRDKDNKVYGVVGISTDITKLKELENTLVETQSREARFKAMAALGGMIAHELRTPLASLKGSAFGIQKYLPRLIEAYEMVVAEKKIDPIPANRMQLLKESVAHMDRSVGYAQATIRSILAAFHDGATLEPVPDNPFSFSEMLNKAINEYVFDIDQESLISIKHVDSAMVLGDEEILIHVIHNLLKNALYAIKAAKKGHITIWTEVVDEKLNFYFEDTALGIEADKLPHIFEAFYTTKEKLAGGIGIGLYFCKMALDKMRGRISCTSQAGQFTRFKITLRCQL